MVGLMEFELEFSPTSNLDRKAASSLFTRLGLALSLLLSTVANSLVIACSSTCKSLRVIWTSDRSNREENHDSGHGVFVVSRTR